MKALIFLIAASCLLIIGSAQTAGPSGVFINEIAWMGTQNSANDEWIELYNQTDTAINIDGWTLKAIDGSPKINVQGVVPAQGFWLLERTDDNTVVGVDADQIYTGALNNSGEALELYNNEGALIDSVACGDGWLAGDNATKQTMERKDAQTWQTSRESGGTPKDRNSILVQEAPPEKTEAKAEKQASPVIVYPFNIVVNEILPSPTGPDDEEEWIEILNQNAFSISLDGWQIVDVIGKTTPYSFPKETTLGPREFLVLDRPGSKITLINSGDGLKLMQPDGNVADAVSYEATSQGESFNRAGSAWLWSKTLTPGATNIVPTSETIVEETAITLPEKELAAVGPQVSRLNHAPYIGAFVALILAFVSGFSILILKKSLK